jgi:hypothetical protein
MTTEQKPKSASDPLFYTEAQPQVIKLSQAQQARQDQIALAGRAKLTSLSARLEAAKPKIEPDEEPAQGALLPAVIPAQVPATREGLLAVMNNRHAIIDNVGNKTMIACWEPSPIDPSRQLVVFHNKESFLLRYSNRSAKITIPNKSGALVEIDVPIGPWWLAHQSRAQFRGIIFQPNAPRVVNNGLNLWRGWGFSKPRPGDWSLIRKHIKTVLADNNPEFAEYIICWIAWAIQNPDKRAEVALVLIGEKGAGKGTLVRILELIFGHHCYQVSSTDEVVGRFNAHLEDCILYVCDEAYWTGDKRAVGKLQTDITEPTIVIERKGVDRYRVRNMLHHLMLAEPGWVIPAGRYERRYAAISVSKARLGDKAYFTALYAEIENGGAEAMFHDLLELDLGDWHPRQIPECLLKGSALQKQQILTLPATEQWYIELLHCGRLPLPVRGKPRTSRTKDLIEDAILHVPKLRGDLSDVALRNFLMSSDATGIVCKKYRSASANGWTFPPLTECRDAWCKLYGPTSWDTDMIDWGEPVKVAEPEAGEPTEVVVVEVVRAYRRIK